MLTMEERAARYDNAEMVERAKDLNLEVASLELELKQARAARAREARRQVNLHPAQVVATRFGVSRETVYQWIRALDKEDSKK